MLYPKNFENKISFDQIRGLIKERCVSQQGAELIDAMAFSSDFDVIVLSLTQIEEMMTLLTESGEGLPLGSLADLRPAFARTQADGTFLDVKDVVDLRLNVSTLRAVTSYLRARDEERFPALIKMAESVELFPDIEREIERIINKYGEVKDTASPQLAEIRRSILSAQSSISKTLNAILRQAQASGIVDKEAAPTIREGRLVIPVAAMNKRKIQGIIHDESATGKTAFVEPTAVVEVNNRLRELENEERREIIRILVEFTNLVRPYYEAIAQSVYFLAEVDALRAKSQFSISIRAIKPYLVSECEVDWHEARHPLLEISLTRQGRKIEPLTIKLTKKQRILLISGPNAGGKSVCLKTVGLLQYMLQCGLPIPLHERSRAGLFKSIFIDIGDEQSIENDLSTYSSHLLNMKNCIKFSNGKSLLLIDEFGTGTEPMIGGAIAEAVLTQLNEQKAYGVITTHYSNLKHFAERTEGVINGAMLYDRGQLKPLFQLSIGQAGSSFAVEIARQIGLPETIIQRATDIVGEEHIDYDKHLQDIARDKRYWENKRQNIRQREKHLEEKIAHYEEQMASIKAKKRAIIEEANAEAANLLRKSNATIERTIREIKEAKAEKKATQQAREKVEKLKEIVQANPIAKQSKSNISISFKSNSGATEKRSQNQVLRSLSDLKVLTKNPAKLLKETNTSKAKIISSNVADELRRRKLSFSRELDIRGLRVDEALEVLIAYIDDALMVNAEMVTILHGTGTGALKQVVRDYLLERQKTMQRLRSGEISFHDGGPDRGGAGITIVEL